MHSADGFGAAGPPPGRPSGTVLNFGRYAGWSLGEVARTDLEYVEWLDRAPIGRNYRQEIDEILRKSGRRVAADAGETERRGLFRRTLGARPALRRRGASRVGARRSVRRSVGWRPDRPVDDPADRRALDEQREQDDPERDLLEQGPLRDVGRQ